MLRKRASLWGMLCLLLALAAQGTGFAADENVITPPPADQARPFTFGGELDFASRYVWRGIPFSSGPVLQPSAWISTHGFTFTAWSNVDLTDEPGRSAYNELDLYFTYRNEWKKLGFETSLYVYYYPTQAFGPGTAEFYLKLSYPVGPLKLFTAQSLDIAQYQGAYFGEFGLAYEKQLASKLSLQTSASFAWANGHFNNAYLGVDQAAANLFTYNLKFVYYPVRFFFLRPHMEVTALLDGDLRSASVDPTIVSGGLALGVEF